LAASAVVGVGRSESANCQSALVARSSDALTAEKELGKKHVSRLRGLRLNLSGDATGDGQGKSRHHGPEVCNSASKIRPAICQRKTGRFALGGNFRHVSYAIGPSSIGFFEPSWSGARCLKRDTDKSSACLRCLSDAGSLPWFGQSSCRRTPCRKRISAYESCSDSPWIRCPYRPCTLVGKPCMLG
jgi:hypothetical protein